MIKYVVIDKRTKKEVTNDLDDAITARGIIDHLENKFPLKYPEGSLCWTKKNVCEHNNNGWCMLKDTGEYGYLCKDQECTYKRGNNDNN